jgi:Ca-activated chloride channel homolog
MTWYRSLSTEEYFFISLFILFYALYLWRVISAAQRLNTSYGSVFKKTILRTTYFILFIIALLGPSFGITSKEIKSIGKDIMIAVDLSKSMDALDIQPSRLSRVKFELNKLISAFPSDRVGLIIFSSEAFVQCPLTYDQSALSLFIETLNTGLTPGGGTDLAAPLKMALSKLMNDSESGPESKSKLILLISDGEDFGEETKSAVAEAKEAGIKVFTLGVGTEAGGKIKDINGFKKDFQGNEVITRLNPSALRKIAEATNGRYFEINNKTNESAYLISAIQNIEGELRDMRTIDVSANKYEYFLAIAMALFLIDMLISYRAIKI